MKFIRYILTISFFVVVTTSDAYACCEPFYKPSGYLMFRLSGKYDYASNRNDIAPMEFNSNASENCRAWQKLTSKTIALDDIYELVYKFTVSEMKDIRNSKFNGKNSFAQWIMSNQDYEVVDLLIIAKTCEQIRGEQNSPWYYPADDDGVQLTLADIAEQAMQYKGSRLYDRYVLQTTRALFALRQYDQCVNYYNEKKDRMNKGVVKDMTEAYIAGANFRTGSPTEAMTYYAQAGDFRSLILCSGKDMNRFELINLVYTHCPDSPALPGLIENVIRSEEVSAEIETEFMSDETSITESDTLNEFVRLRDFAIQVGSQNKVKERAMWYYTGAFITDMLGDPLKSNALLKKAEMSRGNSIVKESIKVFRIYLDAKTRSKEPNYEQLLFAQLRWLDNKITRNMPNDIDIVWQIQRNESCHYWNDMLRRILLSQVCPRMLRNNKTTRALQLANMADYRLINSLDKSGAKIGQSYTLAQYRNSTKEYNSIDYSGNFFALADTLGADQLISYNRALGNNTSKFDRFVNSRSFVDNDFLNDLVGTKLLHEMRYAKAEYYLLKVQSAYQYRLNTCEYMQYDPFSITPKTMDNTADYKYHFAIQMQTLANEIKVFADPNRKAHAMIRFAVGLRNSIKRCWPLTHYYTGWVSCNLDKSNSRRVSYNNKVLKRSDLMIEQALAMFTDAESAAAAHRLLYRYKTAVNKFPNTRTANEIRGSCDVYYDYSLSNK